MQIRCWKNVVIVVAAVAAGQGAACADQYLFAGARATGMAGATAASPQDSTAVWHNPAAFGFMAQPQWSGSSVDPDGLGKKRYGWEILGLGAGYTLTENMGRYLDILADIDFGNFEQGNLSGGGGENVRSLLALAGVLSGLDSGDSLYADATVGMSMQIGQWGFGIRAFGEGVAYTLPDLDALSLASFGSTADLEAEIALAAGADPGFNAAGYTFTMLTPDQQTDLGSTLGVASNSASVKYIDFSLQQLADAGDLEGSEIAGALDTIGQFLPQPGVSIDTNQTVVAGRGFTVIEIPISYGWAVTENLSVGATAKAMYGSVLGSQVWIFDGNNDTVLQDLSDNVNSTLNLGLDLGVLFRIPQFQFALVGRNLNRPQFDGFTETVSVNGIDQTLRVPDVNLDPQMVLGAAFMPTERLTLEADVELLEAGSLLEGYDIQRLSVGGEVDFRMLALRLGAYRNMAVSWQDWVATAGIGMNLGGLKVDVGGAYSLGNTVEYDGRKLPAAARLYAGVGMDF